MPLPPAVSSVASQALNMGGNLLLVFAVARTSSPDHFGMWSLAYLLYVVATTVSRASLGATVIVSRSAAARVVAARAFVLLGTCVVLLFGTVGAVVALSLGTGLGVVLSMSVAVVATQAHDAMRFERFAMKKPEGAMVLDATWAGVQGISYVLLFAVGQASTVTLTLAWGGSAALAAVVRLRLLKRQPGDPMVGPWLRHEGGQLIASATESSLGVMAWAAVSVVTAAVAGLEEAGALRGAATLLGGLSVVVSGLTPLATLTAREAFDAGASMRTYLARWSVAVGACGGIYAVALLAVPDSLGRGLLGGSWQIVSPLLLPMALQGMLRGPLTGGPIVLRVARRSRALVSASAVLAAVAVALPSIGALASGASGAAWGMVGASSIGVVVYFVIVDTAHERRYGLKRS